MMVVAVPLGSACMRACWSPVITVLSNKFIIAKNMEREKRFLKGFV